MDLRQFSTTPNNFDERRTSVSSMSSGQSGYSAYGSNTPANLRFGQSRYFGQPPQHQPQQVAPGNSQAWTHAGVVAPWIEQQQQVSQSTTSVENQNFVNSYGHNLNGANAANGHAQQANSPQIRDNINNQNATSLSLQASFDSQSSRPSPTSSSALPLKHENDKHDNNDSNDNDENDDDDELIPTAIVIKNIPFAIKKEQLLEVMTSHNLPLPYAFNYHFDNGVFRGLAFANFTSTDETTAVVSQLNGREIGGRKLRVEYKKMLPLAERERIEREKREKRGQLEEQHRSTSSASLASMVSISSTTPSGSKSAEASVVQQPVQPAQIAPVQAAVQPLQPLSLPLQPQHSSERYYAPIPFVNNLPLPPQHVDFNDPETLEFYSQLLFFKDDREKQYAEIAYPVTLSPNHKRTVSLLCQFLGLVEVHDNNLILVKRRAVVHDPSPLLRPQSHSSIPLLNQQQSQQSQRYRQQQQMPQQAPGRMPPNFNIGGAQSNNAISNAALLRNNPTPTQRGLPQLYNNQQSFYQGQQPSQSQPSTPGLDPMSRFNLQPNQWEEQYQAGPPQEADLNDGLNALNLGLDNGSNIWGPRSMQPTA